MYEERICMQDRCRNMCLLYVRMCLLYVRMCVCVCTVLSAIQTVPQILVSSRHTSSILIILYVYSQIMYVACTFQMKQQVMNEGTVTCIYVCIRIHIHAHMCIYYSRPPTVE